MSNDTAILAAISAFLPGLMKTQFSSDVIVRGSFVSRLFMAHYRRPCHDLDLLLLVPYDVKYIESLIITTLGAVDSPLIKFRPETLVLEEIWKQSLSPGVRVSVNFEYQSEEHPLQIDIAANDPLALPPIDVKIENTLDKSQAFTVSTVALEIAVSWKLHGLFEHLNGAWLPKTLWDLYVLCRYNQLDVDKLRTAIELAFVSRLDPVNIMKRFLYGDFGQSKNSQRRWNKEIPNLSNNESPSMETVLLWLRDFFANILMLPNDGSLLTHSEVITYRVKELRHLGTEEAIEKLKTLNRKTKILPYRAYHSIPHLPGSRTGTSDKTIDKNKTRMLTSKQLKKEDVVIVQEKLDGSCVCVYRRGNEILALGRDSDLASESPNAGRRLWSEWVATEQKRFSQLLGDGERVCGEWLALVHGTRYTLIHEPFVAFDLFDANNRQISQSTLRKRCKPLSIPTPHIIHEGEPCDTKHALTLLHTGFHGAIDAPEGLIWRLERDGLPLFSAKYVQSQKVDGCYLPEQTGEQELWNWPPNRIHNG